MNIKQTNFKGLYVIEPKVFEDSRGYFFESFNQNSFVEGGITEKFVQDNQSQSEKGVLRGLHFQNPPFAQGKLVRVISGAVLDIAVDIRKSSATYGKHFAIELTGDNKKAVYIPPGFAHGFLTLENNTIFSYKCTNFYNRESEDCILWNDPLLSINWGITNVMVSEKDGLGKKFIDFESKFQ